MKSKFNTFKLNGFVNFGKLNSDQSDFESISESIKNLYQNFDANSSNYQDGGGADGVINLPIYDDRCLLILNEIVSNGVVKTFLSSIFPNGFKVWAINLRVSKVGDAGLYIHQDGVGQMNMMIMLNDCMDYNGVTAVLPRSHLFPFSQKKFKLELPVEFLKFFPRLFKPLFAKKGDVLFFTNKIWHGRFPNYSNSDRYVLMVAFYPSGFSYGKAFPDTFIESKGCRYPMLNLAGVRDLQSAIEGNCYLRDSNKIPFSSNQGFLIEIEKFRSYWFKFFDFSNFLKIGFLYFFKAVLFFLKNLR